jgi:hypothetical protein
MDFTPSGVEFVAASANAHPIGDTQIYTGRAKLVAVTTPHSTLRHYTTLLFFKSCIPLPYAHPPSPPLHHPLAPPPSLRLSHRTAASGSLAHLAGATASLSSAANYAGLAAQH